MKADTHRGGRGLGRVLVSGATGFAGRHLIARLMDEDDVTLVRAAVRDPAGAAAMFESAPGGGARDGRAAGRTNIEIRGIDIGSTACWERLLDGIDTVYHLAGVSFVPDSWRSPARTLAVNVQGTLNLLEAARAANFAGRLVLAGSGDVYGLLEEDEVPVSEEHPVDPRSPYALSKYAAERLGVLYRRRHDLDVVVLRLFNHTGPGQRRDFVVPSFAAQVAAIKLGLQEAELRTGDLRAIRDFTDVRDVARAYTAAGRLDATEKEVFNVGSGRGTSMAELVETLLELAGVDARVVRDPALVRPLDNPVVICNPERFRKASGWRPLIPMERTLADMLDEWTRRLSDGTVTDGNEGKEKGI